MGDKAADLIELDDVGMIEQFQYLNLAINFPQIVVVQPRLVDNLNRNLHPHTRAERTHEVDTQYIHGTPKNNPLGKTRYL